MERNIETVPTGRPDPVAAQCAGPPPRPVVLLVNLGTPDAPTASAVRPFLREFLSDRRVVRLPRFLWLPILNGIVLAVRPRRSARLYASIWEEEGSPLMVGSQTLTTQLHKQLGDMADVHLAMTYGRPSVADVLDRIVAEHSTRPIIVVPLYPQCSGSSTGAVHDAVYRWGLKATPQPDVRLLRSFPTDPAYLDAVAGAISAHWAAAGPLNAEAGERLLLSYHGIPTRHERDGDSYRAECEATSRGLRERLDLDPEAILTTYQSKFGPGPWLTPATIDTVSAFGSRGTHRIDVVAPGFAVDCLETLEELNRLNRHTFIAAGGGEFHYIPWSRNNPAWDEALAGLLRTELTGQATTHEVNRP